MTETSDSFLNDEQVVLLHLKFSAGVKVYTFAEFSHVACPQDTISTPQYEKYATFALVETLVS